MEVKVVNANSLVEIKVSTGFFARLQEATVFFANQVTSEELAAQIENLKQDKELSEFGTHYETLLILLSEIEEQATAQGLTQVITLPESTVAPETLSQDLNSPSL